MSTEGKMAIDECWKYLRRMQKRYIPASKKKRSELLDEMETFTGLHRKTLIRLMHSSLERQPRSNERGETYGPDVDDALRAISESADYICPERLTPNLVWFATHLEAHDEMTTSPALLEQLGRISVSTVRRRLNLLRQDEPRLPRPAPVYTNCLTKDIPMRRIPWNEPTPGHFEVDLVHHCGPSACGEYLCTLQMLDVATNWSERVPVLGRSYLVMQDAFLYILFRLPFPVLEVHPDNGSEFFNHHLIRFWGETVQDVQLSRSRPYQKNDNRIVEQKNSTLVRAYLGNDRLDTVAQTLAVNALYDQMWLYYNFFQPVMHLTEKIVTVEEGGRTHIKRRYDQARTPFERLCATAAISHQDRELLEALRDYTNPRQLRQDIYDQIDIIFSLPGAVSGSAENVFQTLMTHTHPDTGQRDLPTFLTTRNPIS